MMQVHEPTVRTRTWPIGDMVSTGCARTLEKAVAALPGVNATSANFATATLQVSYDPARLSSGAVATRSVTAAFNATPRCPLPAPPQARTTMLRMPGTDRIRSRRTLPTPTPATAMTPGMPQVTTRMRA